VGEWEREVKWRILFRRREGEWKVRKALMETLGWLWGRD
jgi:hypothetical protein